MRQHFTYQLDEEKIRKELRDRRVAPSEDAYQRFCAYSDTQVRQVTRRMPAVNIKINRRFVVPAAAAIVLITLSFLLANFIGGKNDKRSAEITAEPFVPMPQSEVELIPQPETQELPHVVTTDNSQALETSKPELVPEKKSATQPPGNANEKSDPPAVTLANEQPATTSVQPATTQVQVRKKERRDAEDILEPVQMPDIRPTLLTNEQQEEIRTN